MSVTDALLAGRAAAEALMVDTCRITRAGARGAFNPSTLAYGTPAQQTVYAGPCRVQVRDGDVGANPQFGERAVVTQDVVVQVPVSARGILPGDRVEITAATLDPDLEGNEYTVAAIHEKTHATARRLRVEQVSG